MDILPRRKNPRLKDYDYSQAGYYFVTICTKGKQKLFGEIIVEDDPINSRAFTRASEIGKTVSECWNRIDEVYESVGTSAFCLMPNHIHGIIAIPWGKPNPLPLYRIIQGYKSVSTRMCAKYDVKDIWQRNYYERIIRNEQEYRDTCEYIENNPLKWFEDKYYI